MTDFLRLKIEIYNYRRIAERAEFFASVGEGIEDAVTGQRGNGDWFGEVTDFFDDVRSIWNTMEEREAEGVVKLNHDSPDHYLANVEPKNVGSMGLVELFTLLRKATVAKPDIESYNWSTPGNFERKPDPERDQRFITAFRNGLIAPALQKLNKLMELSPADIEAVLELKPILDSLTVEKFRTYNGPRNVRTEPMEVAGGGQALHVPYPDYHPVVTQWTEAVYCTPFYIDPYREVPGKEGGVPPPRFMGLGEHGRPTPEEFFAVADLDEVRQYMSLCLRGEEWCDGFIAGEFERGVIRAAFERLRALHAEGSEGDIPWVSFDQLAATYINGGTPPSSNPECWGGDIGFISTAWIAEDQTEVYSSPRTITTKGVASCSTKVIEPNALLVGTRVGVGKAAVNRVRLAISQDITAVRLKPSIEPIFASYAFKLESAQAHFRGRKRGATIQGVSRGDLQELKLPLHTQESQRGIVQTLEAIQAARLARLKEIELERERKAALMAHLFAYGTKNEPRRDTPLGPMPESWECIEIREIGACQSGGTPSRGNPAYFGGLTPWVKTLDMDDNEVWSTEEGITDEGLASIRGKVRPVGTVMVAMYGGAGTVGKCGILRIPAATNQAVCCVETNRAKCFPEYLFQYFVYIRAVWMQYAGGTRKDPNIGKGIVERKLIPLPPYPEQRLIAECLQSSHQRLSALEVEAKLLDELFRATLEELMSGRLPVAPLLREVVA